MKQKAIIALLIIVGAIGAKSFAQTSTPTPSSSNKNGQSTGLSVLSQSKEVDL